ncbi:MAG: STAS domain-containing protein [Acidimicrobiales bacterium]
MSREGDRVVVWLHGDQDVGNANILRDILATELIASEADVVVDLGEVTFIGSATIGAFVSARTAMRKQGRELTLRAPNRRTRRLLDILGLSDILGPDDATELSGAADAVSNPTRPVR